MDTDLFDIDAEKLKRMIQLHVRFWLFDLRDHTEFMAGHISNAFNLPAADFLARLPSMVPQKDTPIVIYDADGSSTKDLAAQAVRHGFINLVYLDCGYKRYQLTFG